MGIGGGGGRGIVLAAASEVGSGKALVPVLACLAGRGVDVTAFLPASVCTFTEFWRTVPERVSVTTLSLGQSVGDAVGGSVPIAILVGTTVVQSLERQLTLYARERGIWTVAVVDERYAYRQRFADENDHLRYLPDVVAVMDEECYAYALAEGLPEPLLRVTGSPILSYLVCRAPELIRYARASSLGFGPEWKQVTFVSETFARDSGSAPSERGRLGNFLGFTEDRVRHDLLAVLAEFKRPIALVERLHPSDERPPSEGWIHNHLYWKQIDGGDLWSLLLQSDAVVGMRSMALLEAGLLGCRVASYQPDLVGENKCAAVRFSVAARLEGVEDLRAWLLSTLWAPTRHLPPPRGLPFVRPDAAERVTDLVLAQEGPE